MPLGAGRVDAELADQAQPVVVEQLEAVTKRAAEVEVELHRFFARIQSDDLDDSGFDLEFLEPRVARGEGE